MLQACLYKLQDTLFFAHPAVFQSAVVQWDENKNTHYCLPEVGCTELLYIQAQTLAFAILCTGAKHPFGD